MINTIVYDNYTNYEYYTIVNDCIILNQFCYAIYEGNVYSRYEIIPINKELTITLCFLTEQIEFSLVSGDSKIIQNTTNVKDTTDKHFLVNSIKKYNDQDYIKIEKNFININKKVYAIYEDKVYYDPYQIKINKENFIYIIHRNDNGFNEEIKILFNE